MAKTKITILMQSGRFYFMDTEYMPYCVIFKAIREKAAESKDPFIQVKDSNGKAALINLNNISDITYEKIEESES